MKFRHNMQRYWDRRQLLGLKRTNGVRLWQQLWRVPSSAHHTIESLLLLLQEKPGSVQEAIQVFGQPQVSEGAEAVVVKTVLRRRHFSGRLRTSEVQEPDSGAPAPQHLVKQCAEPLLCIIEGFIWFSVFWFSYFSVVFHCRQTLIFVILHNVCVLC